jgi:glycosyltransferase involved in cell wall biosynthesis
MVDVSIIVTTFNYGHFLEECLKSCLGQLGASVEYEVVVVDDGSTDDTPAILARYSDSRLRLLRIENSGIEVASNLGFESARGRYIVRVDADDVLASNYLARMTPMLSKNWGFCYSDYTIIDSAGVVQELVRLPSFDTSEVMTRGDFLATGTLYPASLLRRHGGYSVDYRNCGLENYELIIKMIRSGVKGVHVAEPLFQYRRHSVNFSAQRARDIITFGQGMFQRYRLGTFRTNKYHPYKLVLPG